VSPELAREAATPARKKGRFDGLRLGRVQVGPEVQAVRARERAPESEPSPEPVPAPESPQLQAALDYARAFADGERMFASDLPLLPHQEKALATALTALESATDRFAAAQLHNALVRNPGLAGQVDAPGGVYALGKAVEREIDTADLNGRAARFVEDWRKLDAERESLFRFGDRAERQLVEGRMTHLAEELKDKLELQGLLHEHRQALGLGAYSQGRALDEELSRSVGRERDRGRER